MSMRRSSSFLLINFGVNRMAKINDKWKLTLPKIWNKGNITLLLVGVQTCTKTMEICMVFPQKTEKWSTSRPFLGIYPNGTPSYHKDTWSTMFILALFIVARKWKQYRRLNRRTSKENCYIYTMEYSSGGKRKRCHENCRQVDGSKKITLS